MYERRPGARRRRRSRSRPSESVAIVGPTGVGKSTLAQLLVRLADPDDGRRAGSAASTSARSTRASLRRASPSCSRRASCSRRRVRREHRAGLRRREDDVVRAAMIAACRPFIRALPRGYDTVVGERGLTLSGGERQRVALARALVRAPRVLILDDATSAVDPSIEAEILAALRRELATTLVVVAYRLSTIRLADRVIFLRGRARSRQPARTRSCSRPSPGTRRSSGRTSGVSDESARAAAPARRRRRAAGARGAARARSAVLRRGRAREPRAAQGPGLHA